MENAVLIRNDVIVGGASSTASNVNYINEDESVTSVQETIRVIKQDVADLSGATFPDFDKAEQIYVSTSTNISNYDFTAPSNGYINYKAFKGDIMVSYGSTIRCGVSTTNNTFASGGTLPIKKGVTAKITGRVTSSDGEVKVYFITE